MKQLTACVTHAVSEAMRVPGKDGAFLFSIEFSRILLLKLGQERRTGKLEQHNIPEQSKIKSEMTYQFWCIGNAAGF